MTETQQNFLKDPCQSRKLPVTGFSCFGMMLLFANLYCQRTKKKGHRYGSPSFLVTPGNPWKHLSQHPERDRLPSNTLPPAGKATPFCGKMQRQSPRPSPGRYSRQPARTPGVSHPQCPGASPYPASRTMSQVCGSASKAASRVSRQSSFSPIIFQAHRKGSVYTSFLVMQRTSCTQIFT